MTKSKPLNTSPRYTFRLKHSPKKLLISLFIQIKVKAFQYAFQYLTGMKVSLKI